MASNETGGNHGGSHFDLMCYDALACVMFMLR